MVYIQCTKQYCLLCCTCPGKHHVQVNVSIITLYMNVWCTYNVRSSTVCCAVRVQVLSESVSKALELSGEPQVQRTAEFVGIFDKFFDIMNVSNFSNGKMQRKVFKNPYRSSHDFRLKVCIYVEIIHNSHTCMSVQCSHIPVHAH